MGGAETRSPNDCESVTTEGAAESDPAAAAESSADTANEAEGDNDCAAEEAAGVTTGAGWATWQHESRGPLNGEEAAARVSETKCGVDIKRLGSG